MADTSMALAVIPENGVDAYRMSTNAATVCGEIVKATAQTIQGKKYVRVEGWQAIAIAHGCSASSCSVEVVEGGIRAIGQVRRMDTGAVIAEAEGFVGDDEKTWASRAMFARRAMAQTRAISRACRSAFAHVVILIDKDLGTTPAEEMQGVVDYEPNNMTNAHARSLKVADADKGLVQGNGDSQYKADKFKAAVSAGWKTTNKTPRGRDDQILAYLDMAISPDHIATILKVNEEHIATSECKDAINDSAAKILQWFTDQAAKGQAA